jgi:hypothetical protein
MPLYSTLQLEQTVTKLQTALALSPEQVAALPPPTLRIRQLEQENAKLMRENEELRRQLHMQTRRPSLMTDPHFDMARRGSFQSSMSSDYPDRELKRRRLSQNVDGVYLVGFFFPLLSRRVTAPALALLSPSADFFTHARDTTEPQPDSEPTDDGSLRPSDQLFATAATATTLAQRVHDLFK